jgi:hypothetical protein
LSRVEDYRIFCRSLLSVHMWPDSEPIKLLTQPKTKSRRGGGLKQITSCCKVLLQATFKTKKFCCIAFYESYLSTHLCLPTSTSMQCSHLGHLGSQSVSRYKPAPFRNNLLSQHLTPIFLHLSLSCSSFLQRGAGRVSFYCPTGYLYFVFLSVYMNTESCLGGGT